MPSNKPNKRDQSPEMPDLEPLEPKTLNEQQQTAEAFATKDKKTTTTTTSDEKAGPKQKVDDDVDDVKLNDLAQPSSGTMQRLNALKNNQLKYLQAQTKYFEEFHALQSKYARVYADIFDRRRQIVSGQCEPGLDECKWPPPPPSSSMLDTNGHDGESKKATAAATANNQENGEKETKHQNGDASNEKSKSNGEKRKNERETKNKGESWRRVQNELGLAGEEKGVPNFWLEVLQSSRATEALIFEHDEPVLAHLVDVRVRVEADKPAASYTLEFEFAEDNPYFRNRVLTKTFEFRNEINPKAPLKYHGPDLVRTVGCQIEWKPRKNVTVKVIKKKLKSRNRKAPPKIITKEEKQHSFFRFFESHNCITNEEVKKKEGGGGGGGDDSSKKQVAVAKNRQQSGGSNEDEADEDDDNDNDDDGDIPEDDAEFGRKLTDTFLMMHDYSIAERLRNKIIPKAVLYMTGEVAHSDDEDDDADDDDDDDDYDDDDYYDEDDDEDYSDEDDDSDHDNDNDKKGKVYSEWTREMSERIYRPMGGRAINPAECKQS